MSRDSVCCGGLKFGAPWKAQELRDAGFEALPRKAS